MTGTVDNAWGRNTLQWVLIGLALLVASPGRSAFEAEAVGPAERGAGTAMALSLGDTTISPAFSVYGFNPFGLSQIDFASVSVAVPMRGALKRAAFSYTRLAALSYCEQTWTASAALGRGRALVEPRLRLGCLELDGALQDWAVLVDLAARGQVTDALTLAVAVENPLALGLVKEHSGVPQRLKFGLGILASGKLGFGFEVLKEPRFPISVRSGVEWNASRGVCVRAGMRTSPAELAFGVGLRHGWVAIDVASGFNLDLGTTHEAGITLIWK